MGDATQCGWVVRDDCPAHNKLSIAVEALEDFANPDSWVEQPFEAYDVDGIERSGMQYVYTDGNPADIATEILAKIRGEK